LILPGGRKSVEPIAARVEPRVPALPFFPPLAERRALTADESMRSSVGYPTAGARPRTVEPKRLGHPADIKVVKVLLGPVFRQGDDPAPPDLSTWTIPLIIRRICDDR
jgi:hypothetical protein